MIQSHPDFIPLPFAENGVKNTISTTYSIPGSAAATWDIGFPPITRIAKAAGGKPPLGLDFQGLFYAITSHLFWIQSGGIYTWNNKLNYLIGNQCRGSDGELYQCLKDCGPDIPDTGGGYIGPKDPTKDTTHWVKFSILTASGITQGVYGPLTDNEYVANGGVIIVPQFTVNKYGVLTDAKNIRLKFPEYKATAGINLDGNTFTLNQNWLASYLSDNIATYTAGNGIEINNDEISLKENTLWGNTYKGTGDLSGDIYLKHKIARGEIPETESTVRAVRFTDSETLAKTGWLANIESLVAKKSDSIPGLSELALYCYRNSSSTERVAIKVIMPPVGDGYTEAPHPPTGDSSRKIATTGWVKTEIASAISAASESSEGETGGTYTAGDGINISGGAISINTTWLQDYFPKVVGGTDIDVTPSTPNPGKITYTIDYTGTGGGGGSGSGGTTYSAGTGISLSGNKISVKQQKLWGNNYQADSDITSSLWLQHKNAKGSNPSSGSTKSVVFTDNTGGHEPTNVLSSVESYITDSGDVECSFYAYKNASNSSDRVWLKVVYPKNGDGYAEAPHPPSGDSSKKIATTAWVLNNTSSGSSYSVGIKSTRSNAGSGDWTITGLTTYKPLFILVSDNESGYTQQVKLKVKSGAKGGESTGSSYYKIGNISDSVTGAYGVTNVLVTIPTSATVVVNILGESDHLTLIAVQ